MLKIKEFLVEDYEEFLSEEDFVNNIEIKESYSEVVKAIRLLDEKYRIPLTYKYFYEKSIEEIAGLMEISEETVYKRLQRGRAKLIEILQANEMAEVRK